MKLLYQSELLGVHDDNYNNNWKVAEKGEKVICAQSSLATSKSLHDQREVFSSEFHYWKQLYNVYIVLIEWNNT